MHKSFSFHSSKGVSAHYKTLSEVGLLNQQAGLQRGFFFPFLSVTRGESENVSKKNIYCDGPLFHSLNHYPLKLKEESKWKIHRTPKVTECAFAVVQCRDPAVELCLIPCWKIRWPTCLLILKQCVALFWFMTFTTEHIKKWCRCPLSYGQDSKQWLKYFKFGKLAHLSWQLAP